MAVRATRSAGLRTLALVCAGVLLALSGVARAGDRGVVHESFLGQDMQATAPKPQTTPTPLYNEYRGVTLDQTRDAVHEKIGKPKTHDKTSDTYVFSDDETATVYYDSDSKVKAVVATYMGGDDVPVPEKVFGAAVEPQPDGSLNKLVRYVSQGYWVSYSRIAGDRPVVIVTMKKIEHPAS